VNELTRRIRDYALNEAGFDLAGFSKAELPPLHGEALAKWVADGFHGTMGYMDRAGRDRSRPQDALASAQTVISLAVNYFHPDDPHPGTPAGKVAKYAYGADYHDVIGEKLAKLAAFVLETGGPGTEVKTYVDTGPILEKAFAREAGLGFFGKNTNLLTLSHGSWIFLASLLTNLELEAGVPHAGACGTCRLCIDACPTGALLGDYRLDARKCISYLTIESKEEPPAELKSGVGEWAFGCDVCQDVCPYNKKAKPTRHAELHERKIAGTWLALDELEALDDAAFRERFRGSPVKRAKRAGLLRNARTVRENLEARAR